MEMRVAASSFQSLGSYEVPKGFTRVAVSLKLICIMFLTATNVPDHKYLLRCLDLTTS